MCARAERDEEKSTGLHLLCLTKNAARSLRDLPYGVSVPSKKRTV